MGGVLGSVARTMNRGAARRGCGAPPGTTLCLFLIEARHYEGREGAANLDIHHPNQPR
jgi:hypothetical protein